jgi:hypothetical protein
MATALLDERHFLVGEYDVRAMNELLRITAAHVTVVDSQYRTILSNVGYQAFTELESSLLRDAVTAATANTPTTAPIDHPGAADVAVHRVGSGDATARLGWIVVEQRDPVDAHIAADEVNRTAMVISGSSAALVIAELCWLYVTSLRPLRTLGAFAESIAAAERGGVRPDPVAPQRVNEVGAVAAALNRRLSTIVRHPPGTTIQPDRVEVDSVALTRVVPTPRVYANRRHPPRPAGPAVLPTRPRHAKVGNFT